MLSTKGALFHIRTDVFNMAEIFLKSNSGLEAKSLRICSECLTARHKSWSKTFLLGLSHIKIRGNDVDVYLMGN